MTEELKTFLVMLGLIAAVLLIAVIFLRNTAFMQKFMGLFLVEVDEENKRSSRREETQKSSNEPIVEMAKLVRKSDDRLRVYESDGSMHIVDEYFELEFLTRKGKKLKIGCSEPCLRIRDRCRILQRSDEEYRYPQKDRTSYEK